MKMTEKGADAMSRNTSRLHVYTWTLIKFREALLV